MVVIRSRKIKFIILGIFDKKQHNRQYIRLCYKYLPGRSFKNWLIPDIAAKAGHLYVIDELRKQNHFCTLTAGYLAAEYGHLHVLQYLFKRGMPAKEEMLIRAVNNCHFHIIQFLFQQPNFGSIFASLHLSNTIAHTIMTKLIEKKRLDIIRFIYEQISYYYPESYYLQELKRFCYHKASYTYDCRDICNFFQQV